MRVRVSRAASPPGRRSEFRREPCGHDYCGREPALPAFSTGAHPLKRVGAVSCLQLFVSSFCVFLKLFIHFPRLQTKVVGVFSLVGILQFISARPRDVHHDVTRPRPALSALAQTQPSPCPRLRLCCLVVTQKETSDTFIKLRRGRQQRFPYPERNAPLSSMILVI